MSPVYHLIAGAFASMTAPFAIHQYDRERAAAYLGAAVKAQISWADAEQDIRDYLSSQNCNVEYINQEVDRARPYLEHWL